ncbi:MAG: GNAT family N-acetyltransferase [Spirochaetales bacterium]|nr:GNAT family N-acetyltransferase [Spirochaetales bacterium]
MNFENIFKTAFIKFPRFQTARLKLLPLELKYTGDIFEMFSNPEVVKFYDLPVMKEMNQAENFLKNHIQNYKNKKEIRWGLILRQTQMLVGTCGIAPEGFELTKDCTNIGLGFDLNREYWRKGLMKEAITRIMAFCFKHSRIEKMHLENLRENINCIRLAESLFFKILKTRENVEIMPKIYADVDYYEISRSTYVKHMS